MKKLTNPIFVSCLSAGLGVLCLAVRLWMMKTGIDSKDLLVDGHPGDILSWVLTGLLAVLLGAAVFLKPEKYGFQSNPAGGIGAAVCALALAFTAVLVFTEQSSLFIHKITGKIAPLSYALAALAGIGAVTGGVLAFCRFRRQRAWLPLYLPGLVAMMLLFLCGFRYWGAESELQRYLFSLCAQIFILLSLFYRAAAECRMRAPVLYLLFSCGAIFFGLASVADGGAGYLYGLWGLGIALENLGLRVGSKHHAAS